MGGGGAPTPVIDSVGRYDAWLFAAAPNQSAQEDAALGHGIFTHYLLQALDGAADMNGNGQLEVQEIYNWTAWRTATHTAGAQVPSLRAERVGWGELPLNEGGGDPSSAVLPWYSPIWEELKILIDGEPYDPGPIPAGRREVELWEGERRVLSRGVRLEPGEPLDVLGLHAAAQPRVALSIGGGWTAPRGLLPPGALRGGAWWLSRARTNRRWALGVNGGVGFGVIPDIGALPTGAAQLAVGHWWSGDALTGGPTLGAGALWRVPSRGLEYAPTVAPGGHLHRAFGSLLLGLDGLLLLYPGQPEPEGGPARLIAAPALRLSAGFLL